MALGTSGLELEISLSEYFPSVTVASMWEINNFLYDLFTVLPGQAQVWRSEHAEDPMFGPDLSQAQKPGHPQHHTA
jgi:hypothetical protein